MALLSLLNSCKTAQKVIKPNAIKKATVEQIIKKHNQNFIEFTTLNIKATIKYQDKKTKQTLSADIRIKKDEIIWMNIKFLGFPVAKALITPTKISYYETINNTYFEGDFTLISNWLGTNLDFQKTQNLLLGKVIEDINNENFTAKQMYNMHQLSQKKETDIQNKYTFDAANFLLKSESIYQKSQNRTLDIKYVSYVPFENALFPKTISIRAIQDSQVSIDLEYNRFELNKQAPLSFSIPNGYEKVEIK